MSHADRRERRRLMAEAVKGGLPLHDVAFDFGVSEHHARGACREWGVRFIKVVSSTERATPHPTPSPQI